jgi:hypothetical protein
MKRFHVHVAVDQLSACGREPAEKDVRIQGSFRRCNGHASDIGRRRNLIQAVIRSGLRLAACHSSQHQFYTSSQSARCAPNRVEQSYRGEEHK